MIKQVVLFIICLSTLLVSAGCNTLADARAAKGTGKTRAYNFSFDTVWENIPYVLSDCDLKIAGENKDEGYILAQKGITLFSYGEQVAIFVSKIDESKTKVEIVSKKSLETNILAWNWEKPILDGLDKKLTEKYPETSD
jgi:hypothetical protein